jgi:hypothetical protein
MTSKIVTLLLILFSFVCITNRNHVYSYNRDCDTIPMIFNVALFLFGSPWSWNKNEIESSN